MASRRLGRNALRRWDVQATTAAAGVGHCGATFNYTCVLLLLRGNMHTRAHPTTSALMMSYSVFGPKIPAGVHGCSRVGPVQLLDVHQARLCLVAAWSGLS